MAFEISVLSCCVQFVVGVYSHTCTNSTIFVAGRCANCNSRETYRMELLWRLDDDAILIKDS